MSDEEKGAEDAALPEDCVVKDTGEGDEDFHPFDDVEDAFQPGPAVRVMEDGLPKTVDQTTMSDIPALSQDSLICMGDFSKFVLRDQWRDVIAEFHPSFADRSPEGRWRVPTNLVLANEAIQRWMDLQRTVPGWEQQKELALLRALMNHNGFVTREWIEVEPLRPPCKHYVQQKTQFKHNAQHEYFPRLCSARRTTEGTFMTVGETGMWACTMREPRDIESEKQIEQFDTKKVAEGKNRQYLPLFGHGPQSIFDSPQKG